MTDKQIEDIKNNIKTYTDNICNETKEKQYVILLQNCHQDFKSKSRYLSGDNLEKAKKRYERDLKWIEDHYGKINKYVNDHDGFQVSHDIV